MVTEQESELLRLPDTQVVKRNFQGYKHLLHIAFDFKRLYEDPEQWQERVDYLNNLMSKIKDDPDQQKALMELVDIGLNKLREDERTVLRLRYVLDQTGEQIAYPTFKEIAPLIPSGRKRKEGRIGSTIERTRRLESRALFNFIRIGTISPIFGYKTWLIRR